MPVYDQIALDVCWETSGTISSATIASYYKAFRDVCVSYFNAHPVKLGGPGKVIKIDEAILALRKNNKGRIVPHQWCFGGIERAISASLLQLSTGMLLPLCRLSGSISSGVLLLYVGSL
ncbi:unnamed protein product [Enterobius vermicularis]|uniref:Core-binding (CB) domain-containing protein n=1 Tax=Enterobius vermicularis TaxID=51028 RepID=A0A0N4VBE6_ENTVE|nr:unnamed protein product [Enterobius vermicularis]